MKPQYHSSKYRKVALMVGTNDLQDAKGEVAKLAEVVEQYKELISNTQAISEDVYAHIMMMLGLSGTIKYKLKDDV